MDDSRCPSGHNTTASFKTKAPASFKRLLGAGYRGMQGSPFRARKGENEKETGEEPTGDSTTMEAPTIGSKVGLRCQPTEEVHDPWVFVPSPREPSPGLTLQVGCEATQDKGQERKMPVNKGMG